MYNPVTGVRNQPELFMECEEEELTPSQREANRKAQTDYKSALQKIEDAKTVQVPRPGPILKSLLVSCVAPTKTKKREIADVIVIDDDPPQASPLKPAKRGRPPLNRNIVTDSTRPHTIVSSGTPIRSPASIATNLIVSSSNMSHAALTQRASTRAIVPPNGPSFSTLPTTLQSNDIGIPMGKRVLLAMPVGMTGNPSFVLSTGIKQYEVISAMSPAIPDLTITSSNVSSSHTISSPKPPADKQVEQKPLSAKRRGCHRKIPAPSSEDEKESLELSQPDKAVETGRRMKSKQPEKSTVSNVPGIVSGTYGLGIKRPRVISDKSSEAVQRKPRIAYGLGEKSKVSNVPSIVSGTYGLGIKRPRVSDKSSETVQRTPRSSYILGGKRSAGATFDMHKKSTETVQKKQKMATTGHPKKKKVPTATLS